MGALRGLAAFAASYAVANVVVLVSFGQGVFTDGAPPASALSGAVRPAQT